MAAPGLSESRAPAWDGHRTPEDTKPQDIRPSSPLPLSQCCFFAK